MSRVYVLVKVGSEYNDEIEVLGRGEDHLEKAYTNEEEAKSECLRRNVDFAKKTDLSLYAYESEVPNLEDLNDYAIMLKLRELDLVFFRVKVVELG